MRLLKTTVLLLAAMSYLTAGAQQLEHKEIVYKSKTVSIDPEMPYNGFRIRTGEVNLPKENALDFMDISLGYVGAYPLAFDRPVYVQYGLNVGYNGWTVHPTDEEIALDPKAEEKEFRLAYAQIPVNFGYMVHLPGKVSLFPHAGVNGKVFFVGNISTTAMTHNIFGDNGFGYKFRRLHAGWQAGMDVIYRGFVLGAEYTQDFTDLTQIKPTNTHAVLFHLGVNL